MIVKFSCRKREPNFNMRLVKLVAHSFEDSFMLYGSFVVKIYNFLKQQIFMGISKKTLR